MNLPHTLPQRQTGSVSSPSLAPLLWVEYSQTLQHSCAAHTTRSLFTAEQPVTLPGPHSTETLASDPVAAATPQCLPALHCRSWSCHRLCFFVEWGERGSLRGGLTEKILLWSTKHFFFQVFPRGKDSGASSALRPCCVESSVWLM